MTLYSMMEIFNGHPPGVVVRAPQGFIPHPANAAFFQAHGLTCRLPLPIAAANMMNPQFRARVDNSTSTQGNPAQPRAPKSPDKPPSSFRIADILNGTIGAKKLEHKNTTTSKSASPPMRHFDDLASRSSRSSSPEDDVMDDEEIDVGEEKPKTQGKNQKSPLDALFKMTSKTFEDLDGSKMLNVDGDNGEDGSLFSKSGSSKKRRKSRTAFTNQQIFELEKRFLYQKYLTPADRDEIALQLGLSNAQVITWFQNRRAKLKRDLEELKADVTAAKVVGKEPPSLLTRLEEMQAYTTHHSFLKWDKKQMKGMSKYSPTFNKLPIPEDNQLPQVFKPATLQNKTDTENEATINSNVDITRVARTPEGNHEDSLDYSVDSEQEAMKDRLALESHRNGSSNSIQSPLSSPICQTGSANENCVIDYSLDSRRESETSQMFDGTLTYRNKSIAVTHSASSCNQNEVESEDENIDITNVASPVNQ